MAKRRTRARSAGLSGGKTIQLPKGEVGRVAAKLVKEFAACESGDHPSWGAGRQAKRRVCVKANLEKGGASVLVCAAPTDRVSWKQKGNLAVAGSYSRQTRSVRVDVEADACASEDRWKAQLMPTLRHELTHAADPRVHVRKSKYNAPEVDACAYINDPVEVPAFLAQTEHELLSKEVRRTIARDVRKGGIRANKLHEILHESKSYLDVVPCLKPENKRRFLQLAARLWASGKLGPLPED